MNVVMFDILSDSVPKRRFTEEDHAVEAFSFYRKYKSILRWHRELVAGKFDAGKSKKPEAVGRSLTDSVIVDLVLRFAKVAGGTRWPCLKAEGFMAELVV